jgi:hypothetical protein
MANLNIVAVELSHLNLELGPVALSKASLYGFSRVEVVVGRGKMGG